GRPVKYGAAFVKTLAVIREEHGLLCGKLLAPYIRSTIDFLAEEPKYGITEDIYRLLLEASPAEADILLATARKAREIKGLSLTRAAPQSLRAQAPVQTHYKREAVRPGQFAFDTVAHCGGSAKGRFRETLTGTVPAGLRRNHC
ncbi:MAG: transposase, partial [Treponema sp.]|nr:transposase [Treponema sp.]